MNESAAGQRPPALQSIATTTPSSPASSRASRTGTTSVTPPSTSRRPFHANGRETPGELARGPHRVAHVALAEDDGLACVDVGREHDHGRRRASKIRAGTNSSISAPSRVPERSPPPQPRTHIQGWSREAWSTSWSRSAPAGPGGGHERAAAHSRDPRHRHALALERAQDARVDRGMSTAPGERQVESLHSGLRREPDSLRRPERGVSGGCDTAPP